MHILHKKCIKCAYLCVNMQERDKVKGLDMPVAVREVRVKMLCRLYQRHSEFQNHPLPHRIIGKEMRI